MDFNSREYYSSHSKLSFIGYHGQQKLKDAKVLVIGAGGLGCPCLLNLTTSGIGTIGIADFDIVSISNLHRQTLFTINDSGRLKTGAAIERLKSHNPETLFVNHSIIVGQDNVLDLIDPYDIVVDCTDNFLARYLINDACVYMDKPLVYGAIHQAEGHLTVFNYENSGTLRCLFPEPEHGAIQSCADIGAYNVTTALIGTMMANETLKIALENPNVLSGTLLTLDSLDGTFTKINYKKNNESLTESIKRFSENPALFVLSNEAFTSKLKNTSYQLIDVRTETEHDTFNLGGTNIPFDDLISGKVLDFDPKATAIFYCQQGFRSYEAVKFLRKLGFNKTFCLRGSMSNWINII
ncbi:hypothetical protein GS399_02120 [Pedobacter sp. HMF7647]|uniref:Rhodanese domain-containing protein n=1 Tax=Hufsiella arboris TaxID=2695275 RepID=A0A7K1Y5S0_9SPHI|nr:HesA/MoeB/ThiF family protein [Hufsiella arboris]MXV49751.1 hypothetical protein [Hufsiella arboris]